MAWAGRALPRHSAATVAAPALPVAAAAPIGKAALAIAFRWPPNGPPAHPGWGLLAAGLLLGSILGGGCWERWTPMPAARYAPFAFARWRLVALRVGLVTIGLALTLLG